MSLKCKKCGHEIKDIAEIGRPKIYCGTGCRRAAELEIRRLNNLLAELESILSKKRLGWGACGAHDIEVVESEISRQEVRLRTLLDAEDET